MSPINTRGIYTTISSLIIVGVSLLICVHELHAASLTRRNKQALSQERPMIRIQFCQDSPCRSDGFSLYNVTLFNSCINLRSIENDQISYVKILSGFGNCRIVLFEHRHCRGSNTTLIGPENDLKDIFNFNDKASSYKCIADQ